MRALVADDIVLGRPATATRFSCAVHGADDSSIAMKQASRTIPTGVDNTVLIAERPPLCGPQRVRGHEGGRRWRGASDRIAVTILADGRISLIAFFEPEDEDAALAYSTSGASESA